MPRARLDTELVRRGLAADTEDARAQISSRQVLVDGAPALKPGTLVEDSANIHLASPATYASRGGDKLAGALQDLGLNVEGCSCCDVGAGSGGFTDVLLRSGARHVFAIDVGYGQFHWRLRNDARVTLMERTNFRTMDLSQIGEVDVVVADLSFISITAVAEQIDGVTGPHGSLLLMVKPQFEAPRSKVGAGGIVTDPEIWSQTVRRVVEAFESRGFVLQGSVPSRLKGVEGNQEFFVLLGRRVDR